MTMDATTKPKTAEGIAPGVYLDLDEQRYHDDPALGSGDVRNLLLSPCDFWWGSSMNPLNYADDEEDSTAAKERGTAIHVAVLEGDAAFTRIYLRGPDHDKSMTPAEKGAATKAAKKDAKDRGLKLLPAADYDRVAIASAMILKHPDLARAFTGGIPEVSVFWDDEDPDGNQVRCKARIDYLKPRGVGDLKSVGNWKRIEFPRACIEAIANYRYDIQAAHYLRGRSAMAALINREQVFVYEKAGASKVPTDQQVARLGQLFDVLDRTAGSPEFAFQFVFFAATRAPVTYSKIITNHPQNPLLEVARRDRAEALGNYTKFMADFGPDATWLMLDRPSELAIENMPSWWARRDR